MFQLIFDDMTFNEKFANFLTENKFELDGSKEYNTLGIIGCQSSGKSTLLNHVFGTKFDVMEEGKGRIQTTKGIWIGLSNEFKTLLFDVEGTDSKERGDDRLKFEQCSSLFALAMCDVLMINMWTSDIGRYTASNYGVLKVVFEQNLKLFQQESEKKILIVLRDFNVKTDDLSKLRDDILSDIRRIWSEIPKPQSFIGKNFEDFFRCEFFAFPHLFYDEEGFAAEVSQLKERLKLEKNSNNADKLFSHVNYRKNVPIEGISKYAEDIWNIILKDEDINIPGEREMLARFKCSEAKEEAVKKVSKNIEDMEAESVKDIMPDFKTRINDILNIALSEYDKRAKNYVKHIYMQIRKELTKDIANKTYSSFGNQIKKFIPKYQKNFKIDFEKEFKKTGDFLGSADKIKKKYIEKLDNDIKELKVFEEWIENEQENGLFFDEIIENLKKNNIENYKDELINKLEEEIEEKITFRLGTISDNFWIDLNMDLYNLINENLYTTKNELDKKYGLTMEDYKEFSKDIEIQFNKQVKKELLAQLPLLPTTQIESFKIEFGFKDGLPREWNTMGDGIIEMLFKSHKTKYEKVFKIFRKYKVIKNILGLFEYEKLCKDNNCSKELEKIIAEKLGEEYKEISNKNENIDEIINKDNNKDNSDNKEICIDGNLENKDNNTDIKTTIESNVEEFEDLLTDEEIENLLKKFLSGINEIKEDALRKHEDVKEKKIPLFAWIILIYVSYNDIWNMFKGHYILFIVLVCLLYCTYKALNMLGLSRMIGGLFKEVAKNIKELILK